MSFPSIGIFLQIGDHQPRAELLYASLGKSDSIIIRTLDAIQIGSAGFGYHFGALEGDESSSKLGEAFHKLMYENCSHPGPQLKAGHLIHSFCIACPSSKG